MLKIRSFCLSLLTPLAVGLIACSSNPAPVTPDALLGAEWRVTHVENNATVEGHQPTIQFGSDGSLNGTGGCNRFFGPYETSSGGIHIGPAAATQMACIDSAVSETESRFFAVLERVTRFEVKDGKLSLIAGEQPVIVAER